MSIMTGTNTHKKEKERKKKEKEEKKQEKKYVHSGDKPWNGHKNNHPLWDYEREHMGVGVGRR